MKITIRMLSIATLILWIIIIFFFITAAYSVLNLGGSINLGKAQMLPSSKGITFTLPFSISNNGYYELADFNVTTRLTDPNGTMLDQSETFIPSIPRDTSVNATHTVPIELDYIMSTDNVPLLLNDSSFDIEIFAGLNFARVIPVQISTNATIPWGAPFSHLSVGEISVSYFNNTHGKASIPLSFENHAVFDLKGFLKLEFYGDSQELLASGEREINVPSGYRYNNIFTAYQRQQDISKLTSRGALHVIFETPAFVVDWWEPYG